MKKRKDGCMTTVLENTPPNGHFVTLLEVLCICPHVQKKIIFINHRRGETFYLDGSIDHQQPVLGILSISRGHLYTLY